jgi:hypothetical protein
MGSLLNLFRPIQAMLAQVKAAHQRFTAPGRIEISEGALVIFRWRRRVREIVTSDIISVTIYSVDMFSYDALCVSIDSENTPPEQSYLIYEDFVGFEEAMTALERLPGFDAMWWRKAMSRLRTDELTIAYQRGADGQF